MLKDATALLFFIATSLFWFGALRAKVKLTLTQRRIEIISASSAVAGVAQMTVAIFDIMAACNAVSLLRLLSGINLVGAAATFALAAQKRRSLT